jgi:hypothetical protein
MKPSDLLLALALAAGAPAPLAADPSEGHMMALPEYHAEDASAPPVTEQSLLASERFWPYQAALTRPWRAPGRERPLPAGASGVLIRVEESGMARLDFGRDGLHEIAVGETDLVERANRVRRGELEKLAPNLLLAIGPRLLDSASASLHPLSYSIAAEARGFLCVFADPGETAFADLARALSPLDGRHGVLTVLLPQGEHPDARLRERLQALGWRVPFVYDHLAEAYTRPLLSEGIPLPALSLQTREGRVLLQRAWSAGAPAELAEALDRAWGGAAAEAGPRPPPRSS